MGATSKNTVENGAAVSSTAEPPSPHSGPLLSELKVKSIKEGENWKKKGKNIEPLRPAELQIVRNEQKIGFSPRQALFQQSDKMVLTDEVAFHPAAPLWLTTGDTWT